MTSIIIAGRANSEQTTECIYVAMNIANMYPSSRFTIVLKSKKEWEKYCEDICNLFGIVKKTHPLILFSNGNQIGGQQEFFKLISESFTYDNIIKKGDEYILNIEDNDLINRLTKENSLQIEKEYNCRMKGKYLEDKIKEKLEQIPIDHFDTIYNKYNTIESDYDVDFIDDMNVYVKYDEKFTPDPKDYKEEQEVIETKVSYVEKEEYDNYHAELQAKKEAEEKRKALEEDLKVKKENLDKLKEEGNLTPEDEEKLQAEITEIENQLNPPKVEEEEKNENEENNNENNENNNNEDNNNKNNNNEEGGEKKEENVEDNNNNNNDNNNNNETEEKKEEEEKKTDENNNNTPEENKEVQIDPETGLPIENPENIPKPKEYREINYVCYPDFDIPVEYFEKEILVESNPNNNYELLINPYFTFYGETLINRINDYQGPKAVVKPKPEMPAPVEVNPDEIVAEEQINVDDKNKKDNKQNNNNKKDNKQNNNNNKNDNKKDNKNDTKKDNKNDNSNKNTTNTNNKNDNKNDNNNNNEPQVPNSNTIIENGVELPKPEIKPPREHNPYLPTTYEPNFPPSKQILYKIMIKDYGKLPSLRLMKFEGEDLKFYFDEIPPYQLPEHMKNESNLFNFDENDLFLFNDNDLDNIISIINKTDSYINYKILPYKFTDWKSLNSNKIKVIPKICKDIKNKSFPLFDKIYQTVQKIKRDSFVLTKNTILKENSNDRPNFENILNNSDFDPIFEIPDYFTLENYDKHGIKHLIKFFQKNTFNILNIKLSIKEMMKKLEINNVNGNGLVFIMCKDFLFMAPLTEPFTYTKEKNVGEPIVPIFAEPYYFMGIFTLPIIEADWPESVERKNVKFDLKEILRKSTN